MSTPVRRASHSMRAPAALQAGRDVVLCQPPPGRSARAEGQGHASHSPTAAPAATAGTSEGRVRAGGVPVGTTSTEGGWRRAQCVDLQCSPEPACPICLEVPTIPRLTECGHAFCLLCALRHLETSHVCPVCTAELREADLRPLRLELVRSPEVDTNWQFSLVQREGSWVGPSAQAGGGRRRGVLATEGDPGWRFARQVLADPSAQLARLH
eukprot:CAMPEP_0168462164 /NCGR_PEP_ID=MMETSP0228-20121227/54379_1 /TAXON_ID=133427 /ORGANISM="Protoceratium reticulatum, Strain CCCM 535 (=CCMP 1889)" /LENGTH=210 /DNA_ID=CAMNT_0008477541 /DNA_START=108 /DNA_END=738 /DNA_ORIENTATION=+